MAAEEGKAADAGAAASTAAPKVGEWASEGWEAFRVSCQIVMEKW